MQKLILTLLSSFWLAPAAWACPWCRPRVHAGIYSATYPANLLLVLLPVALLLALGLGVFYWDTLRAYFTRTYAVR